MKYATLSVLLLAALAAGQHWDLMQVDTADWGAGACAWGTPETSFGIIYYNSQTGVIRSSMWNGSWHRNDLPISPVRLGGLSRSFSAARLQPGYEAASYPIDDNYTLGCAVSLNDSWVLDTISAPGWFPSVSFEPAGAPALLYSVWLGPLVYAARHGPVWTSETLVVGGGQMNDNYEAGRLVFDSQARPHAAVLHSYSFPGEDLFGSDLSLVVKGSGGWNWTWLEGGVASGFGPFSLAIDTSDRAVGGYDYWPSYGDTAGLYCMGRRLDDSCSSLAMACDRLNRIHVAWVSDSFRYGYFDGTWHLSVVRPAEGMTVHDILLCGWGNPQPLIVFTRPGDGLWYAFGDNVAGVEESRPPIAYSSQPTATILSGASGVKRLASSVIFDAMGRKVREPKPGVYFIHEGSGARGQGSGRMRKVLVTR